MSTPKPRLPRGRYCLSLISHLDRSRQSFRPRYFRDIEYLRAIDRFPFRVANVSAEFEDTTGFPSPFSTEKNHRPFAETAGS